MAAIDLKYKEDNANLLQINMQSISNNLKKNLNKNHGLDDGWVTFKNKDE
jgi:hypothetical protein